MCEVKKLNDIKLGVLDLRKFHQTSTLTRESLLS